MGQKRGAGEGSVFKRADGRWAAELMVGRDEEGKRKIWRHYGTTRREVADELAKVIGDRQKSLPVTYRRMTLADFFQLWLTEHVLTSGRSPNTYAQYESTLRCHVTPVIGTLLLKDLTALHVQQVLNGVRQKGRADATVRLTYSVLRVALKTAVVWGFAPTNVATRIEKPKVHTEKRPASAYTTDELKVMVKSFRGHPLGALFTFTMALGLRVGEATGVRWCDVDLVNGTISIFGNVQRVKLPDMTRSKLLRLRQKTTPSRRTIPMPTFLIETIKAQKAAQELAKAKKGTAWNNPLDLVFTTRNGTPFDRSNVTHRYQAHCKIIGSRPLHYHDLRHSCASLLDAMGVPLATISAILGHASVSTTANMYLHDNLDARRDALNQMGGFLSQAEDESDALG
jgi:integrase